MSRHQHLIAKTRIFAFIIIVTNVAGNVMLAEGMHQVGITVTGSLWPYLHAFANPWVGSGVLVLICWQLSQLTLLSWADLSYVLPTTSLAYVLSAMAGKLLLQEQVDAIRWIGVALITVGVAIVGRTSPSTAAGEAR